jgi:hypothetical protein
VSSGRIDCHIGLSTLSSAGLEKGLLHDDQKRAWSFLEGDRGPRGSSA